MSDRDRDDAPEDARGPRTWLVLLLSLGLLAAIIGAGVAINRFVSSDSGGEAAAPTTTIDETIDVEPVEEPSATRLFTRTTADGIELRVHGSDDDAFGLGIGQQPEGVPDWCKPVSNVMLTALSANSVAQSQLPVTKALKDKPVPMIGTGGFVEASPLISIVAQVPDSVTLARVTMGGIRSDSMEPVEGIVAMAIEPPPPPAGDKAAANFNEFGFGIDLKLLAVEFLYEDGTSDRMTERDINMGIPMWNDPVCWGGPPTEEVEVTTPPPATLPQPGVFQPEDPAAARAEIEAAFEKLYRNIEDDEVIFELVDDPSGIDLLMDDVLRGDFEDTYRTMTGKIVDLIYFSPDEANFMYTLELDPLMTDDLFDNDFFRLYGRARLIDGVWKITRTTICRDIEVSGMQCTI